MDVSKLVGRIKRNRFDLSDYLIHFTRIGSKSSFETLKEIVTSGRLNCGWSVRNTRRTVFGSRPAVCFTDMPFYSFYQYSLNRKDYSKVDFYGIALPKETMYKLGARNVIYGTTAEYEQENPPSVSGERTHPNLLESEQYRYMLTDIGDKNDWTHEREWRWTNQFNKSKGDYLPIWKIDEDIDDQYDNRAFWHEAIFLIVKTEDEVNELKTIFATFAHGKDYYPYYKPNIIRTYTVSLQKLKSHNRLSYEKLDFPSLIRDNICTAMRPDS